MDKELLKTKLEALIRCIHRIKDQNISKLEELEQNIDKQEIIILNLQRAVQLCVDVGNHILLDYNTQTPSTMADTFKYLAENLLISKENAEQLSHAVGFRNIAVHQYEDIDCKIVLSIITQHLEDFKTFAASIEKLI
ncbi:MAG: DUF86 domain-containing protein [Treponema sp.]|nr:DUF86 domain-containing protein [Treponema sp.]MBP5444172.1 DUF86 domain-containing protein [Treponema sp.]MBP5754205.1 DUF86 domain-containing protein [Treponema sp.]